MSAAPPDPHPNTDTDLIQLGEGARRELANIQGNFPLILCPYEDKEYIKDLNAHLGTHDKEDFKRILHAHLLSNGSKCTGWTVDFLKTAMKDSYGYDDNRQVDKFVTEHFGFASLKLFVDRASDIARVDEEGFIHPVLNDDNRELYEDAMASARHKDDKERKKDEEISRRLEDPEKIRGFYEGVNKLREAILQASKKYADREGALAFIKAADGSEEKVVGICYNHVETEYKEIVGNGIKQDSMKICGRSSIQLALTQGKLKCLLDTIIMQNKSKEETFASGEKPGMYIGLKNGAREYSEAEIQAAVEECRKQHANNEQRQNSRYERSRVRASTPPPPATSKHEEMKKELEARCAQAAARASPPQAAAPTPASTSAQADQQRPPVADSDNSDEEEQPVYSDEEDEVAKKIEKKNEEIRKRKQEKSQRERSLSPAPVPQPRLEAPTATNPSPPPTPAASASVARPPRPEVPYGQLGPARYVLHYDDAAAFAHRSNLQENQVEEAVAEDALASLTRNFPPGTVHRSNPWEEAAPTQPALTSPAPVAHTAPPVPAAVAAPAPLPPTEYNPPAAAASTPAPAPVQLVQQQYDMSLGAQQFLPPQGDPQLMQGVQYPQDQSYMQPQSQMQQMQPYYDQQPPLFPQQPPFQQQFAPQGQCAEQPASFIGADGVRYVRSIDGQYFPTAAVPATPAAPPAAAPPAAAQTVSPSINLYLTNNGAGGGPPTTTSWSVAPNQGQPVTTHGDVTHQTTQAQPPTPSPYGVPQGQGGYPGAPPSSHGYGYGQQQYQPPSQNWQDPAYPPQQGQPVYNRDPYQQGGMAPPPGPPSTVIYNQQPQPARESAFLPPRDPVYDNPQPPQHHQRQRRPEYNPSQQQQEPQYAAPHERHGPPPRRESPVRRAPAPRYLDELRNEGDSGYGREEEERRRRLERFGPELDNARRRERREVEFPNYDRHHMAAAPQQPTRYRERDPDWNYTEEFAVRDPRPRYDLLPVDGNRPLLGPPQGTSTPLNQSLNMWSMFNDLYTSRRRVRWLVVCVLKNIKEMNSERRDNDNFRIIDYENLLAMVTAMCGNEMELYQALDDMTISFVRFLYDMEHDGLVHLYMGREHVPNTNSTRQVMFVVDPFSAPPASLGLKRAP